MPIAGRRLLIHITISVVSISIHVVILLSGYIFLYIVLKSLSDAQAIIMSSGLSSSYDAWKTSSIFLNTPQFRFFLCDFGLHDDDDREVEACRLGFFPDCFNEALLLMTDGDVTSGLCFLTFGRRGGDGKIVVDYSWRCFVLLFLLGGL